MGGKKNRCESSKSRSDLRDDGHPMSERRGFPQLGFGRFEVLVDVHATKGRIVVVLADFVLDRHQHLPHALVLDARQSGLLEIDHAHNERDEEKEPHISGPERPSYAFAGVMPSAFASADADISMVTDV